MKKLLFFIISLALLSSCKQKIDEFVPDANGVDFSNYVAIGNSLTAGYADAALYASGQKNSVAFILSEQFKYAGGGEFHQPLIGTDDGVGFDLTPTGLVFRTKMILKIIPDKDCEGNPTGTYSLKPAPLNDAPDQNQLLQQLFAAPSESGPYNNMGVPGLTLQALFYDRYGDPTPDGHPFNPYYARFATNPRSTILYDAIAQQPTFFTFWIGNNDVLGSALAGTDALVTPVDTFAKYYPLAVGALLQSGKNPKGVLCNVPDISTAPYFSTISQQLPYDNVVLDSMYQVDGLNTLYTMYGHPEVTWKLGRNGFVYVSKTGEWKHMEEGDLFLLNLPTDSIRCKGMGVADQSAQPIPKPYPIPGKYILEKSEIMNIENAIAGYNQVIAGVAASTDLAVADMNTFMKTMNSGIIFDGVKFSTAFVSGGTFSTDGLHLNPKGAAIVANQIIQAINAKYGCNIPQASVTSYQGLIFP